MAFTTIVLALILSLSPHTASAFSITLDFAGIWRAGPHTGQVFEGWAIYETGVPEEQWFTQLGPAWFKTAGTIDFSTARIVADNNAITVNGGQEVTWQVVLGFNQPTVLAGFPPEPFLVFGSAFYEDGFGTSVLPLEAGFPPQFSYNTSIDLQRRRLYEEWQQDPPPLQHTPEPSTFFLLGLGILALTWRHYLKAR